MRTWRTIIALAGLALLSATTAHAQTRQRGFSVVLLLGETQSTSPSEDVPPAVRKALADVKDFLPYKSYRVLETQLVLGAKTATTRLKGLDDQEYDVEINADEIMPNPIRYKEGMLIVLFKLQEVGAATSPGEEFARSMAVNGMEAQRAATQAEMNNAAESAKKPLREAIARLDKSIRMARARKLIDSRFEMAVGETVVVGTSKLGGGDKGLVVLLTAIAAGK
jgi:hypothetical protein